MNGINKVILVGTLGQDPEMRYASSGNAIANISVATSEAWKDKQTGEKQERTEWHRCVAFGRLAEIVGEYLRKGSKVYLEGKLQTRQWEKDGVTRYSTEIIFSEMQMLGGKGEGGGGQSQARSNAPSRGGKSGGGQSTPPAPAADAFDDDIPF